MTGAGRRVCPVEVRGATTADRAALRRVQSAAFGRSDEADLVDALCDAPRAVAPLSLVAVATAGEHRGEIIGHVLFSRATLEPGGRAILQLAPVGVLPELQRQQIGSALIEDGLRRCDEARVPLVAVLGDPAFYSRFGFELASRHAVTPPPGLPASHFQARIGPSDGSGGGQVVLAAAFAALDDR